MVDSNRETGMKEPGITIGIDNGQKGGLAALGPCVGTAPIDTLRMPLDRGGEIDVRTLRDWIIEQARPAMPLVIVLETPLPHMKSSAAVAGLNRSFGLIWGALRASTFPTETRLVFATPGRGMDSWQREVLGVGVAKAGSDTKALALAKAEALWPGVSWTPLGCRTPHDGIIDAALMAHWQMTRIEPEGDE